MLSRKNGASENVEGTEEAPDIRKKPCYPGKTGPMKMLEVPRRFRTVENIMLSRENGTYENFGRAGEVSDIRKNQGIYEKRDI